MKNIDECFAQIPKVTTNDYCLIPDDKEAFVKSSTLNNLAEWI